MKLRPNPIIVNHDPDIGRCDDCGSEEGSRHRTIVDIKVDGEPERAVAWLCGPCRGRRFAQAANAEGPFRG